MTELGVDLASIDGNRICYPVLFSRMRFAYARAAYTYAAHTGADLTFHALRGGVPPTARIGAYLILGWHDVTPEDQVATFVTTIGERRAGELPVALDLEADSAKALGMTPAQCLAWAERALDALHAAGFATVTVYTSARVWIEVFGDLPSEKFAATVCWAKIPYVAPTRMPPQWQRCPTGVISAWVPRPWQGAGSPGVRILQWQGDAVGVDGTTSTVDLNVFVPLELGSVGNGVAWLQALLGVPVDGEFGPQTQHALAAWQHDHGVTDSGELDVATLAAVTG